LVLDGNFARELIDDAGGARRRNLSACFCLADYLRRRAHQLALVLVRPATAHGRLGIALNVAARQAADIARKFS
jgi:hypothetical protein